MTKVELLKAITEASAKGDTKEISRLARELVSVEVDERKAEVVKALAEAEKLAGVRTELETELKAKLDNDKELRAKLDKVKAFGFIYSFDHLQPGDPDTKVIGGLALRTPDIGKAKRTGTGAIATRGNLQKDYDKVVEAYGKATGVDVAAEMAGAIEKDKTVTNQAYSYNHKKKVQKWGIAQGLLEVVR